MRLANRAQLETMAGGRWLVQALEQIVSAIGATSGEWKDVPFSSTLFSVPDASGTISISTPTTCAYIITDKTMQLELVFSGTFTGAPTSFEMYIPSGRSALRQVGGAFGLASSVSRSGVYSVSGNRIRFVNGVVGSAFSAVSFTAYASISIPLV